MYKFNTSRLDGHSGGGLRLDAADIVHFARQLEHIDPIHYLNLVAGVLGTKYLPPIENVSPLDNEYTYRMFEIVGDAKLGGPHAKDHPIVSVRAAEYTSAIKQIPVAMQWTVRELKQSARNNAPLEQMTIMAAMSAIARRADRMIAFGEAGTTIRGLLNHSLVEANMVTPSTKTGSGGGTAWIRTVPVAPAEILADIALMVSTTRARLKQAAKLPGGDQTPAFDKFTILLDTANFAYIANTPWSSTGNSESILQVAERMRWVEGIGEWWQCDEADEAGTGPRAVCYPRDPMFGGYLIPDPWTALDPQPSGHDVVVPAGGSCGGSVLRFPVAASYMDGH